MPDKFTPGPWRSQHTSVFNDQDQMIATVARNRIGFQGDEEANARLIAAAPFLLDVCRPARDLLRLCPPEAVKEQIEWSILLAAMDAAIIAATGEDPDA